jgi:hypothetical protein
MKKKNNNNSKVILGYVRIFIMKVSCFANTSSKKYIELFSLMDKFDKVLPGEATLII